MASGADPDPILARLARHPLAVDVVDVLSQKPLTFATLRARLRVRPRALDAALRLLAADGVIRHRGHAGSWDQRTPAPVLYDLTRNGRQLAGQLDRFDVWVAIYERYLYPPQDEPDVQP